MKTDSIRSWAQVFVMVVVSTSIASAQQGVSDGQWHGHGGDNGSTRYSNLDQITRDSFSDLKIAWKWETIDRDVIKSSRRRRPSPLLATPVMTGGVLYTSTAFSLVGAIDAGTGETVWKYDSGS